MKNLLIIGCGRLGSSLYRMLSEQKSLKVALYDNAGYKKEDEKFCPATDFYPQLTPELLRKSNLIFISVPDDHIPTAAEALLPFDLKGKIVLHTSGLHSAEIIHFLKEKGASTGSLHPVQTFSRRFSDTTIWKDTWCTFEGSASAFSFLEIICAKSGARLFKITAAQKKALHIAAVFSANFSAALYAASEKILSGQHLDKQLLMPLISRMQKNFERHSAYEILSGPLQRGDVKTMRAHLNFLAENGFKNETKMYRDLAEYILSDSAFKVDGRAASKKALKQK